MNAIKVTLIRNNVEAVACFVLFGLLVWVSFHFMTVEKERAMMIAESEGISYKGGRRTGDGIETRQREQRSFLGLLRSKPPSHYNLIVRRNPFAPLPPFELGKGGPISPRDLALVASPSLERGEWVAQLRNKRTGEIYSVRVGDDIGKICKVKRIDPDSVTLSVKGQDDVILKPPAVTVDLKLISTPSRVEGQWVARIRNNLTGEIYSVREGDEIVGICTVTDIDENVVILDVEGEEIILRPPRTEFLLAFKGTIKIRGEFTAQIKNLKTREFFFVREGDTILDIFKVKKIEQTSVTLSREGKEDKVLKLGETGG